jgi:uncharacterized protein involved in outer membrane biogenesis
MIPAKRIFYSAGLLLAAVLLAAITGYRLVADETLVAWITKRVESSAGVRMSYGQPAKLTRTLSPTLTVADLSVTHPESGYDIRTSSLELQISLLRLVLGQLDIPRLWLGDTHVELGTATASGKQVTRPAAEDRRALPPLPALHDVRIAQLHFVSEEKELQVPTLDIDELALEFERDTDTLQLTARIDMADESVAIEVNVPRFHDALDAGVLGFSASARSTVARLTAQGQLDVAKPEFVLDGGLSAQASDLKQIPTGIPGLKVPGTLTVQAQLAGTVERLAVSGLAVKWRGAEQSSLEIEGSIDDLDDLAGVALDLSAQLGESPWLTEILPDNVGALKHAKLSGRISGAARQLEIRDLAIAAGDSNELDVSVRGQLDLAVSEGRVEPGNMDLQLLFHAPTTHAARALLFEDIPEFGAIEGRADIRSETGPPSFESIVVAARDPTGIEVDLSGRIAQFPLDPAEPNRGYDLDVSMKATRVALMAERLGVELPLAGPLAASYRIEGDTQALQLEQIKAAAGSEKAFHVSAEGQVHFREWDTPDPLQMINLGLRANAHDTRTLATLLGTELPELGALGANARLQTVSNRHQISDFELRTAKGAPVTVSLSGAADHVVLLPEPAVEGIALTAGASTTDVSRLNALFGGQDAIPSIGPAKASARIAGSDQQLSVSDIAVSAGKPDVLRIKADGRLGTLSVSNRWHPQGADLRIKANATGSKAFAEALGYAVPELGPVAASAQLRDKDKTLALESGLIRIGDAWKPVVQAEGSVSDLFGAARTRWDVTFDLDGHQFAQFADTKQIPDLGGLHGNLKISNSDGSLGIDTLSISSSGSELLSLSLDGQYGDFGRPDSLSLNGTVNARDLEIVGALLDRDWPAIGPFEMKTKLSRVVNSLQSETRIKAGKAVVQADLVATLEAQPLLVSGKIVASNAFVPSVVKWRTERIAKQRAAAGPVFSRERIPFDWLHKFDLDLSVDVESFDPELSPAQSAKADIAISSGRLWVRPATIKYPAGEIEAELELDAREQPRVSVKAHGADLRLRQMVYMKQVEKDAIPDLDIDIDVRLSGNSPHQLAASAQGDIFLELKNGYMRRDLIDLVFADIIGWAWTKTKGENYYQLNCTIADYSIDQGVLTTRGFLLDADNIAISGEGTIDLGQEQVDYVFLPKKKSRTIRRADPVKVTGALNDPSVKVIPWKSAATTYGPLLFGPFIFAGVTAVDYLGSKIKDKEKESPCLEYERKRAESGRESAAQ